MPKEQDSFTRASFAKSKTIEKTEELPGLLFNMCPLFEPTTNAHRDFTAALFAQKKEFREPPIASVVQHVSSF